MDAFNDLLLILLGSLLAILSPGLIDWIRRAHARKPIRRAIELELDELRYTLAILAYRVRNHLGTLDHDFIDWLRLIEQSYTGPDRDPQLLEWLEQLLALKPPELTAAQAARLDPSKSLVLKEYRLPFTTSQLPVLHDFDATFQRSVLQIHSQLELMNADVPYLMRLHELTFGTIAAENWAVVKGNLVGGYGTLAQRAQSLADRITDLLPLSVRS